jgi:hypothetical protein
MDRRAGRRTVSDANVRLIAWALVRAVRLPAPDNLSRWVCGQRRELPPADEDRVAQAAIALLAAEEGWGRCL